MSQAITEDDLIAKWPDSIRPEDRPPREKRIVVKVLRSGQVRKRDLEGERVAQIARIARRQAEYVAGCVPREPGDEALLRLYGAGMSIDKIFRAKPDGVSHLSRHQIRTRLMACHLSGVALQNPNKKQAARARKRTT